MKPLQNKAGNAGRMVQAEASSSLIFAALNQRVLGSSPSGSTNFHSKIAVSVLLPNLAEIQFDPFTSVELRY